jgi:hypothetical protein
MRLIVLFALLLMLPFPARAELISQEPHCALIKNSAGFTVFGMIRTDYGTNAAGGKQRHESTFRLADGEQKKACATGPFYPGYQVELTIKTLIPVFSCKTRLDGTIEIKSERNEETDSNRIYAVCVP